MTTQLRKLLIISALIFSANSAFAQTSVDSTDPRQMALDIYSGINRGTEPATIALKLRRVIELFRYRCTRVSDYQVFTQRPNITDIKVKCSGDPLYGVTVASNGFVSVYGGNSILAPLDRRDSVILTFDAEGAVEDTSAFDGERLKEETMSRVMLGSEYDYIYLIGMLMILLGIVVVSAFVFVRLWRRKQGRKPRTRMKPMPKFRSGFSSEIKDRLIAESEEISKYIFRHESGIIVAVGKRGKRRLFLSVFGAQMYARWNIHLFEASEKDLEKINLQLADDVEEVEEGAEVPIPR